MEELSTGPTKNWVSLFTTCLDSTLLGSSGGQTVAIGDRSLANVVGHTFSNIITKVSSRMSNYTRRKFRLGVVVTRALTGGRAGPPTPSSYSTASAYDNTLNVSSILSCCAPVHPRFRRRLFSGHLLRNYRNWTIERFL